MYSIRIAPWNSPQCVVASRFKNPSSKSLEGSCLAFSPFASLSRAAFGSSVPGRVPFLSKEMQALRSLLAHLPRLSPASPANAPCPCSTKARSFRSSRKLTLPSASFRPGNPSSHSCERLKEVGLSLRSLLLRVWLPSRGLSFPLPRKPLSAPNALGILPSELSSTGESKKRFPFSSFVPALPFNTFPALNRRSDDFLLAR